MGEVGLDGRVVIAGGSGFLGRNLARALARRGAEVVVLSRSKPARLDGVHHEIWDARTVGDWARHLDGARAAVNLAGRTVDCIKTPDHCDEILRSRVESTRVLGEALQTVDSPLPVWVQMSTAHIYGDPPSLVCDEDSAFGYGLAPTVGKAWEKAFDEAKPKDTRGVVLRTSFVLGKDGGAMPKLSLMARLGLGGKIAKGTQGMSWIHEDDMDRLFLRAIENDSKSGRHARGSARDGMDGPARRAAAPANRSGTGALRQILRLQTPGGRRVRIRLPGPCHGAGRNLRAGLSSSATVSACCVRKQVSCNALIGLL